VKRRDGRGRGVSARSLPRPVVVLLCALIAAGSGTLTACGSVPKPKKACLVFYPSENLNLFDAEPHPITVYVYPLSSAAGFEQTNVDDLLGGSKPDGVLAPPVPITVEPGVKQAFSEMFPAQTSQLGVLADYFRARGDPEGTRTQVVPARCGIRKPKLVLSPKDVYPK